MSNWRSPCPPSRCWRCCCRRRYGPPWQAQFPPLRTAEIEVGGVPLIVELAIAPEERARGLGYREELAPGSGMLFVADEAQPQSFWMKGMRFCLDIVWIEGGEIVGAAENACPDPAGTPDRERERFSSPEPVRYVLEVPAGWLDGYGFSVGTTVEGIEAAVAAS
jgi:uncharacterized membrane protein (UPF0127 family)